MTRLVASLVAVSLLAGCRGSGGTTPLDPFARTRIEPPRTGWISGQPAADPYYSAPRTGPPAVPNANAPATGSWTTPGAVPGTGNRYEPPGGYNYRGTADERPRESTLAGAGDRVMIPPAARRPPDPSTLVAARDNSEAWSGSGPAGRDNPTSTAAATSSAVASAGLSGGPLDRTAAERSTVQGDTASASGERIVRTIHSRARPSPVPPRGGGSPQARSPTERQPRKDLVRQAVNIVDLPPAGSASTTRSPGSSPRIRLVSGFEELDGSSATAATASEGGTAPTGGMSSDSFSPRSRYGHGPEYGWLRGRLEYSQIDRCWKLRYIPIDGDTDDFGGSVVLSDSPLLSGYERGQFVEIHGGLARQADAEGTGYAPEFEIREIKPMGG